MRDTATVFHIFVLTALLLVAGGAEADSQTRNRIDNRGTGFWVAFMPTDGFDPKPLVAVVVTSERPTNGRIIYALTNDTIPITIPVASSPTRFNLDTNRAYIDQFGVAPRRSVRLEFDSEVAVHGVNTMRWSSDAFLAIPDEGLGREYLVLSYPNTLRPSPFGLPDNSSDFPSQFAIVATSPGETVVTIRPSVRLKGMGNAQPFTIALRTGDVYVGQAAGDAGQDVTGTRIEASSPVVVYGGHQRTNIRWDDAVGRDHLVEQLLPLQHWQSRAMLIPHFQLEKTVADQNIVRVLARENNTVVSIDSTVVATIGAGRHVEIDLNRAMLLTASKPVLISQYQHSTVDEQLLTRPNDSIGDPFMMMIPSREQFDSSYCFESFATDDFKQHFINIVIPTERISSIRLDGAPLSSPWVRIPKTSYSYTQFRVLSGEHCITARVPFGLYVYGFGPYNSYGYPAGIVLDTLFEDHREPLISTEDTCGGLRGVAYDSGPLDFGMESLRLLPQSSNVELVTDPHTAGADSLRFRIRLINPYEDGIAELIAVDTAGLDSRVRVRVKGFTVAIQRGQRGPIQFDTLASLNGLRFCQPITLHNYGEFPQTIQQLDLTPAGPGLSVDATFPLVLAPGERRQVQVCFEHRGDTSFTVEIGLNNGCLGRSIATVPLLSGSDSTPPNIIEVEGPCRSNPEFDLLELGLLNAGIDTVIAETLVNATIAISPELPAQQARLAVRRIDDRQDVIYSLIVRDRVGHETRISDTVGGFTLSVEEAAGAQLEIPRRRFDFADLVLFDRNCDSVVLRNYGLLPMTLERVRMQGNLQFSIPPEQLPVVLAPGQEVALALCVTPRQIGANLDTLLIDFGCEFGVYRVEVATYVDPLHGRTRDLCGNDLRLNIGGFTRSTFLRSPSPNPVAGTTRLTFGLSQPEPVTLRLHDANGTVVRAFLAATPMDGGIWQIDADLTDLPSGAYFLQLRTASGDEATQSLIISR